VGKQAMEITRISRASWFKIRSGSNVVHFDPGYAGYFKNQGIPLDEINGFADVILISHFHKDHLQPEMLEKIANENTQIVAPISCTKRIKNKMTVIKPGDLLTVNQIQINVVDAYNTIEGHSTRKVHHKGDFVGYIVDLDDKRIYFAGDTDYIMEMRNLGRIDVAFLPVGGTFVMDIEEALRAALTINPRIVFSMHESDKDPQVFKKKLALKSNLEVIALNVGEKVII